MHDERDYETFSTDAWNATKAGKPSAPICVLREGRKNPNIQARSAAIWEIPDYSLHRVKCGVELLLDEDQQKETIK
jgi:hypothetical protein